MVELVKNRDTREPLSEFNKPLTEPMKKVAASLRSQGMNTFVRWNYIFSAPPLIVDKAGIQEGLNILDKALDEADKFVQ
jgi:taurine--2-oxoglutarate transaminase